ncbi:MAG TPA: long-chain-acyl-CoA synthetase [Caulobacteraceae bacterium]|nr:long-chain-acyl-CoA synthetase [Caulobacteraceae bacterium]
MRTAPLKGLARDWRFVTALIRTLARVRSISATSTRLICDDLEAAVDRWRDRPAISFGGQNLSYGELDALANRFAHLALARGLARGDTVAILLPNRLEYLALWYGLSKVGVVAALINGELRGEALAHCLKTSAARICVVDETTAARLEAPTAAWNLDDGLADAPTSRPPRQGRAGMTAADTALLIYTSGTTGLPKAARITHMRAQLYMRGFAGATGAGPADRLYLTLPLHHATGGLCAMGAALLNGGSVALKRTFSASHFWADVAFERATLFVYIGELCRYLANQPVRPQERAHHLRLAFGNGLRPDVWEIMETRFGVPRVLEFYGSTEGNVSMFNFDGRLGAIGRAPPWLPGLLNVALVRFDVETETPVRGAGGLCIATDIGEAGECLGRIGENARGAYAGYADRGASQKKVLRDVFRAGDAWFATGDLMRRDAAGYFYFVDRVGDTFRWKGENVSTGEVAQSLLAVPGVMEANVYGVAVPGMDGRAGMAALVVREGFDLTALAARLDADLPPWARPLFVRLLPRIETTGTFKHRKAELVADGFDPARAAGLLYFRDHAGGFVPLTPALHTLIAVGEERI